VSVNEDLRARTGAQERNDMLLSIPIQPRHNEPLKRLAARDGRSVSGYVRWLIIRELQVAGLIDADLAPVEDQEATPPAGMAKVS